MSLESQDEQERKLFVGGLNKEQTNEDYLKTYFQSYGSIVDCCIMKDMNKQSRGFGFILFESSDYVDKVIAVKKEGQTFELDGHKIEVKRALPKVPGGNAGTSKTGGLFRKVFVGGLPSTIKEADLKNHFQHFGCVNEVELLKDRESGRLRGFAFITFDDEDSADKCIQRRSQEICKKMCEVKRAQTRSNLTKDDDNQHRRGDYNSNNRDLGRHMMNTSHQSTGGHGNLSMIEVNQLIQQAFTMGQQSVLHSNVIQPPTAASLLGLTNPSQGHNPANYNQPTMNNTHLLHALLGQQQQTAPIPAPIAPPQAIQPSITNQNTGLAQLARLLQSGNIDPTTLSALLSKESDTNRGIPVPVSTTKGTTNGAYPTAYPTTTNQQ
jgi:RNA recognition motif-containing protein